MRLKLHDEQIANHAVTICFYVSTAKDDNMSKNNNLVDDIKGLINELLEEESYAKNAGNTLHFNGLSQARVLLEITLEKHGIHRITTITNP